MSIEEFAGLLSAWGDFGGLPAGFGALFAGLGSFFSAS